MRFGAAPAEHRGSFESLTHKSHLAVRIGLGALAVGAHELWTYADAAEGNFADYALRRARELWGGAKPYVTKAVEYLRTQFSRYVHSPETEVAEPVVGGEMLRHHAPENDSSELTTLPTVAIKEVVPEPTPEPTPESADEPILPAEKAPQNVPSEESEEDDFITDEAVAIEFENEGLIATRPPEVNELWESKFAPLLAGQRDVVGDYLDISDNLIEAARTIAAQFRAATVARQKQKQAEVSKILGDVQGTGMLEDLRAALQSFKLSVLSFEIGDQKDAIKNIDETVQANIEAIVWYKAATNKASLEETAGDVPVTDEALTSDMDRLDDDQLAHARLELFRYLVNPGEKVVNTGEMGTLIKMAFDKLTEVSQTLDGQGINKVMPKSRRWKPEQWFELGMALTRFHKGLESYMRPLYLAEQAMSEKDWELSDRDPAPSESEAGAII